MEAVVAGIKTGAEWLGMEERIRSSETGKLEDILLSDRDPWADMSILQDKDRIRVVIKGGDRC